MKVLTQAGFKHFEAILDQGVKDNCLRFDFEDGTSLICTEDHELLCGNEYIPACFIEVGELLSGKVVYSIERHQDAERVYDLYNVEDTHSYITNGVESHNCNLLFMDEFAFVENASTFYTSTYPVVSSGKTSRVIITSTANGVGNQFHRIWEGAVQQVNEFKPFRVDWWDVPGRDAEWKRQTVANTSELQFEQEFCNSFHGTGNTLINAEALLSLKAESPASIENGVKIYEKPISDHNYVMTVDVAKGRNQDFSTFSIVDVTARPFRLVAAYRNAMVSPLIFPDTIYKYAKTYNKAYIVVESNDQGSVVCNGLYYDLEYENMFVESAVKNGAIGLTTTKKTKRIGCSNLKDLIEGKKLIITDADTIQELSTFEAVGSSYEAADGNHDDAVMSLVIFAWFVATDIFVSMSSMDIRDMLYHERLHLVEEDVAPVGILGNLEKNREDEDRFVDDDGNVWESLGH